MGDHELSEIVREVKITKYFSITVDSVTDVAHVDHITIVLKYVTHLCQAFDEVRQLANVSRSLRLDY